MGKKPKKIWSFRLLNSTTSRIGGIALLLLSVMIPLFLGGSSSSNVAQIDKNLIGEQITVPLPSRTLLPGERIRDVPLTLVSWPRSRLPDGIVLSTVSYQDSIVEHSVEKLNPIPLSALRGTRKTNNPVAEGIPKGMRAITVRVDLESAVEGWVRSGTRVDVVLVKENRLEQRKLKASVIADNVKVLSAGRSTEPEATSLFNKPSPATVTLLVTQEQALKSKLRPLLGN
jgi:Flp pilus assembly protein CpaB